MAKWSSLSKKQQKKFGGNKKAFKTAKKQIRSSGGNITRAKQVVKAHKQNSAPAPSPSPAPSPIPGRAPSNPTSPPSSDVYYPSRDGHTVQTVHIEGQGSRGNTAGGRNKGTASKVTNINKYDTTSYGSGNKKGADKISRADIKELTRQGFSDKEIVDYVENKWRSGTKGGLKAQNLLNQYKERLTTPTPAPTPTPTPPQASTPAPTQGPRNAITPDMYQSPRPTQGTTTEGSSNTNNVTVGGGRGKGNVSINQSNTQTFETVQDNDIVTSVTGNNNKVDNTQDNSVKNYGGDQNNNATVGGRFAGDKLEEASQDGTLAALTPSTSKQYSTDVNDTKFAKKINSNQGNEQNTDVYQDNDIINTVNGDNNRIENNVDNSIRNYGGNQKNFTYIGGENPLLDTPVSAGTMAGYFHDDDSPAKSAAFVDRYETMNRDAAKRRKQFGSTAEDFIYKGSQIGGFNPRELDKLNRKGPQIARDRAAGMALNLFGDRFKASVAGWESPERQSGVKQPDWDELYDKYTDF